MDRKISTIFVVGCLLTIPVRADEVADRIVSESLRGNRAYETLEYLTDDIGPRLTGSAGAAAAVRWTTQRLRSWGFEVKNEKVTVPHWVRGEERGSLVSQMNQKIVLTALGGSVATPAAGLTAEVVEVSSLDDVDRLGEKVRGRIVLFNKPMDMERVRARRSFESYRDIVPMRTEGASRAAKYGAVASLVRSIGSASLRTPHTGAVKYVEKVPRIPTAAVTTEDADLIHRLLSKGEKVRLHLLLTPKTLPDVESANVVAEIRGSAQGEEVVVMGGHLDSWDLATGAIDDGAGVAISMEALRTLRELGLTPKRTIRVVLFMNEENGRRGGNAYFAAHRNETHFAAIESDSGAGSPVGFRTTLQEPAAASLKSQLSALDRVGPTYIETVKEAGADISPLEEAGVPGFSIVEDPLHYFDYHHTPADTLDKVDPTELQQNVAAMTLLAWTLANRDQPLK
ncbi:MAG TPA: M20/M25/M40 family metallo-hydrolase [Thermoanaerobaculia bacterium]|nr:M20/M25/M40 family metallo-hydrolase [Thermoanaerobaculia bacterium]